MFYLGNVLYEKINVLYSREMYYPEGKCII